MKKGLLIFGIITTVLAAIHFAVFIPAYVGYLNFDPKVDNENAVASIFALIFGGILGGAIVLVFNILTIISSAINMIPNAIHFGKCKKPGVIVLFVIACLLLASSIGMLIYFIASGSIQS